MYISKKCALCWLFFNCIGKGGGLNCVRIANQDPNAPRISKVKIEMDVNINQYACVHSVTEILTRGLEVYEKITIQQHVRRVVSLALCPHHTTRIHIIAQKKNKVKTVM